MRATASSAAIHASAKRASDLAARYGGEEFLLLLPDTPEDEALRMAEPRLARQAIRTEAKGKADTASDASLCARAGPAVKLSTNETAKTIFFK